MQTVVFCIESFEGIHCFPNAPEEVCYLRNAHRHIFNIKVEVNVFHDDRDVEFIMLKHRVREWLSKYRDQDGTWRMEELSCEQVACRLISHLDVLYNGKQ